MLKPTTPNAPNPYSGSRMLTAALAAFWLVSALAGPAFAEEGSQATSDKVTSVEVEGNKIVSSATILTKIKTRPGDRIAQQTVDEDIKRLYSTGFFSDVSADVRPYQGGQMVRCIVQERPLGSG